MKGFKNKLLLMVTYLKIYSLIAKEKTLIYFDLNDADVIPLVKA